MAGFDDFIQELQSWDNNEVDIATFLNIFEYTGFDPSIIQKKIFNLGKNDAARDVKVMCLMFLLRENNLTSLDTKSSEARIKAFKAIKAKYGLTKDKTSTSITLPRVAACFPWVYMQLLASLKPERPITKAELVDLDATDYPLALMAQPALSLLTEVVTFQTEKKSSKRKIESSSEEEKSDQEAQRTSGEESDNSQHSTYSLEKRRKKTKKQPIESDVEEMSGNEEQHRPSTSQQPTTSFHDLFAGGSDVNTYHNYMQSGTGYISSNICLPVPEGILKLWSEESTGSAVVKLEI